LNAIHHELKYFLPQKMSLSSQKYWFGNRIHPIPGPESRGQKGAGSRSATLVPPLTAQFKPIFKYSWHFYSSEYKYNFFFRLRVINTASSVDIECFSSTICLSHFLSLYGPLFSLQIIITNCHKCLWRYREDHTTVTAGMAPTAI
jgi:hypothetical protein